MPKALFLSTLSFGLLGSFFLSAPIAAKSNSTDVNTAKANLATPLVTAETRALLLKIATDKLCNPESEMYCEPHTVFVKDGYAVVLASVQPTAGIFQVYKQVSTKNPQTAASWELIETFPLNAFQELIEEANLPKTLQAHFIQAFEAYIEKRKQKSQ